MARDDLKIDELKYNFDHGARPNRFVVNMFGPIFKETFTETEEGATVTAAALSLEGIRVESCSLPGRELEVNEYSEYGTPRRIPHNVNDGGTVDFTFICDSNFVDRAIIEVWQEMIFGGDSKHPRMKYYNDYVGTVEIEQLNMRGKPSLVYTLHEAYPISFAPQELSYVSTNELLKFTCTIAFRNFTTQYKQPSKLSGINRGMRVLESLLEIGSLAEKFGYDGKVFDRLERAKDRLSKITDIFGG